MVFQAKGRADVKKVLNWGKALRVGDGGQGWDCMGLVRSAGAVPSCISVCVLPQALFTSCLCCS